MPHSIEKSFREAAGGIERGIAFLVYSDPGIGKTTMAQTLPVGETLFLNTDAGEAPLYGTKHIIFDLQTVAEKKYEGNIVKAMEEVHVYLNTQKHPFKYVVIDNVSEIEQRLIAYLTKRRRKEFTEIREYGDATVKIREYLHLWRDLVFKGITVVVIAWEAPVVIKDKDGLVITRTFPKLSKKVATEICGIFDVVGHIEVYEKTQQRWVRFAPSEQYITKSQFKGLDDGEPADFPHIIKKLREYDYGKT